MRELNEYLEVTLDLEEPVEIVDLAGLFSGLGADFDRYVAEKHPDLKGNARMYVRSVREGSIIANLFADVPDLIGILDGILIVGGFGALFNQRIRSWMQGQFVPKAKKSDLENATSTLKSLAKDKDGKLKIERFYYRKSHWESEVIAEFTTNEARQALETIQRQKQAEEQPDIVDHAKVLMIYKRMDKSKTKPGTSTGDRVVIEQVDPKDKAVFYASDNARDKIKSAILNYEDPWNLGFVVDVSVATRDGKPVAYSVIDVHEIIEL